jgi:hypothetical protein
MEPRQRCEIILKKHFNRKGREGSQRNSKAGTTLSVNPMSDALPLINPLFYLANLRVLCGKMQFLGL